MLLRYFGLKQDPFGTTPDPRSVYPSNTHREALASLKYGFYSNRGFTSLIAPPGMGKTTLLFRFLEDIQKSARTVFLFDIDAQCEARELVGYILRDIGITPGPNSAEMHEQLNGVLVTEARAGRKFVVVIDEAQNLSEAALEMVRLLTNFETPRAKLMQIVLAGQPQLLDKLMKPTLVQLRQRISTFCHLEPLSAAETNAYIDHRLNLAGYSGAPLFTRDALNLIIKASNGTPRTINNICFNALSLCRALKKNLVDDSMVAEVIADLQLNLNPRATAAVQPPVVAERRDETEQRRWWDAHARIWVAAAAALLVGFALGVFGLFSLQAPRFRKAGDGDTLGATVLPATLPSSRANLEIPTAAEINQSSGPFEIIVEPHRTLRDIALQYLGAFNPERLHQIQSLNPALIDPDHIEVGQKIWLPGPQRPSAEKNQSSPANIRSFP